MWGLLYFGACTWQGHIHRVLYYVCSFLVQPAGLVLRFRVGIVHAYYCHSFYGQVFAAILLYKVHTVGLVKPDFIFYSIHAAWFYV